MDFPMIQSLPEGSQTHARSADLIRPQVLIRYRPEMPTSPQMILDSIDISPRRKATRSKRKNPINPQLIAPMMAIVKIVQSIPFVFISSPPNHSLTDKVRRPRKRTAYLHSRRQKFLLLTFHIVCPSAADTIQVYERNRNGQEKNQKESQKEKEDYPPQNV